MNLTQEFQLSNHDIRVLLQEPLPESTLQLEVFAEAPIGYPCTNFSIQSLCASSCTEILCRVHGVRIVSIGSLSKNSPTRCPYMNSSMRDLLKEHLYKSTLQLQIFVETLPLDVLTQTLPLDVSAQALALELSVETIA